MPKYDYLIVGSGFSGLVFAEQASAHGKTCLIVDKRDHIGGNCHDHYDENGVLIHTYGPHYFRTNSNKIKDYLSRFTKWRKVEYRVQSFAKGRYWSFPVNLKTYEQYIGRPSSTEEFEAWLEERKVPIEHPSNSEDVMLSQIGRELYELFFEGYTLKQWNRHPKDLDASVCKRIPIRTTRDDLYLREKFQALPQQGYSQLFENIVKTCGKNVCIQLNTDYREIIHTTQFGKLVYTGPIDEYFNYQEGALPYRSLRFEREHFEADALKERMKISGKQGFWQPEMQVNYPNDEAFTRIVEIKHATGQDCPGTTIVREYPEEYEPGKDPYYPIPSSEANELYQKYKSLATAEKNTIFIGRLATYRYLNMDQVIGIALSAAEKEFKS